jgi:hypothetical protein
MRVSHDLPLAPHIGILASLLCCAPILLIRLLFFLFSIRSSQSCFHLAPFPVPARSLAHDLTILDGLAALTFPRLPLPFCSRAHTHTCEYADWLLHVECGNK